LDCRVAAVTKADVLEQVVDEVAVDEVEVVAFSAAVALTWASLPKRLCLLETCRFLSLTKVSPPSSRTRASKPRAFMLLSGKILVNRVVMRLLKWQTKNRNRKVSK
jgi:hypothetical protein